MKATWIWLLIAAAFGWIWYGRSKRPAAAKSSGLPEGANIGQIGSRIENPAALQDFAQALRTSNEPRVVSVTPEGTNWQRWVWTDGRVTIADGTGNVLQETIYTPSP